MKTLVKLFILLIVLLAIFSCGEPPEDAKERPLIEFIKEGLDALNKIKGKKDETSKFFQDISENFQMILAFYKGTAIEIQSDESSFDENAIVMTLPDNQFKVLKSLYLTFDKKKTFFSFDKKTWYSNENNMNKAIEGIKNDYHFKSEIHDNTLKVIYKMAFSLGGSPVILNEKDSAVINSRKTVTLQKGMIFSNYDEKMINTNLNEKVLFMPAGTLFSGYINVSGNILKSQSLEKEIRLEAMQDLYFFVKNKMISFSFDKKDWKLNILSFSVDPQFEVYAKEDNHVYFRINADAVYNEKETSFSLIKLIIGVM